PLVAAAHAELGLQRVASFGAANLSLVENCQWPYVLGALDELFPGLRQQPIRTVAMRLSPAWSGPAMVTDSLSHVLSLVQALVPLPSDAGVTSVVQSSASPHATENVLRMQIIGGKEPVAVEL